VLLVTASMYAAPAAAQVEGSIGVGAGTVRYPGGSSFGSAVLSSSVRYAVGTLVADLSSGFASLPGGIWSAQGRLACWGTTSPLAGGWRLGIEAILAGTSLTGGGPTGAAHGVAELLRLAPRWGVGIGAGPSTGGISDEPPVTVLHTRARFWWRPGNGVGSPAVQLSVEPTRFPDGWFTDASAGATLERGRAIVSLWTTARLSSAYPSTAAGSAYIQVFLRPRVSLELGGGSSLRDPYQGLPRAGFVTFGVRFHKSSRVPPVAIPRWSPLVPEARGDSLVVRFRMPDARTVAIAGDWNAWKGVPLRRLGDHVWEGTLGLRRGVYHFNLLVDGSDWVVPNGVATVPDGLGGMVAVLIVP
jgi:AMP-activated protein kinase-like protein